MHSTNIHPGDWVAALHLLLLIFSHHRFSSSLPAALLPLLSFLNDIKFRTSVTSKGSSVLIAPGHGPLPTCRPMFFILPTLPWSSIHFLSTLLLPGSSIMKWTSHSSRNIGILFQSSAGAENPRLYDESFSPLHHLLCCRLLSSLLSPADVTAPQSDLWPPILLMSAERFWLFVHGNVTGGLSSMCECSRWLDP